jgi:hypothetical protein
MNQRCLNLLNAGKLLLDHFTVTLDRDESRKIGEELDQLASKGDLRAAIILEIMSVLRSHIRQKKIADAIAEAMREE